MQLQCTIQDGEVWFSGGSDTIHATLTQLNPGLV
jgi:hypothetical protein